jgi:hypothetical protein
MSRMILKGITGVSPLGFLASLGLLRLLHNTQTGARLAFLDDGSFHPFLEGVDGELAELVARDAADRSDEESWLLTYDKAEKKGVKKVADLKAPPEVFRAFLIRCVDEWILGKNEGSAYASAFGTSEARDGKGNTKPTAFHFTAANQQFLEIVRTIRSSIDSDWVRTALLEGPADRPGSNLRWDPAAERNWALMAANPIDTGTSVNAPVEWLAFRGLPLLPTFPKGARIVTTGVTGRGDEMAWTWPIWTVPASLPTVCSVLQIDWKEEGQSRSKRGIACLCTAPIRRTAQGFGSFGPAAMIT